MPLQRHEFLMAQRGGMASTPGGSPTTGPSAARMTFMAAVATVKLKKKRKHDKAIPAIDPNIYEQFHFFNFLFGIIYKSHNSYFVNFEIFVLFVIVYI